MNVASVTNFPLPLPAQRATPATPTNKSSTAGLLINIPRDAEAAIELSERIADAFAANSGLRIATSSLTA